MKRAILLLIAFGFSFLSNSHEFFIVDSIPAEKPLYETAVLNYTNLDHIQKLKKVEFGVNLKGEVEKRIREFTKPGSFRGIKPLNPFISDDFNPITSELTMFATFKHKATGIQKDRNFFYYHEYEYVGNGWEGWNGAINDSNKYLMRVRFAPPLSGEWEAQVTISFDGQSFVLPSFDFHVDENDHPGYVKIHENGRNLQRGNSIFFPIGHVFPGPYNREKGGQTPWGDPPNGSSSNTTVADWKQYIGDIESYILQGGKSLKLAQTAYGNLIEFEKLGSYIKRMHYAWEQDKIIDLCEKHDVLINFNLLFQDVIMGYGQNGGARPEESGGGYWGDGWDYGNYSPDRSVNPNDYFPAFCYFVPGTLPSHQFTDSTLMNFHKQRTRYYEARYGYSPQIYTWELMSEPFHMNQFHKGRIVVPETGETISDEPATIENHPGHKTAIEGINTYHEQLSEYIKKDLKNSDHLITIDLSIMDANSNIYPYKSVFNPSIDIVGYNYYSGKPNKLVENKQNKNGKNNLTIEDDEKTIFKFFNDRFNEIKKPLILSEAGHVDGSSDVSCYGVIGNTIDAATLGFTGIAGVHPWEGYQYGNNNQFDERLVWPSAIAAEKRMNSRAFLSTIEKGSGNWKQGRQVEKVHPSNDEYPKELQYYISNDNLSATGYIRNRTYNTQTKRLNDNCLNQRVGSPLNELQSISFDQKSGFRNYNLYVTGLEKDVVYRVRWFEFLTGIELPNSVLSETDNKNRLMLVFPDLTVENPERPILWFTIEEAHLKKTRVLFEKSTNDKKRSEN